MSTIVKERPILFSDALVRAVLDGRKTVTRRPVQGQNLPEPGNVWADCCCREIDPSDTPCVVCFARFGGCPAEAGDRLWVRECFRLHDFDTDGGSVSAAIEYRAGGPDGRVHGGERLLHERLGWRPSIHMPRWASRLLLDVVSVTVERVQDINDTEAILEGFDLFAAPRESFRETWDSIYGTRPGLAWSDNPWVWRVEFRRVVGGDS